MPWSWIISRFPWVAGPSLTHCTGGRDNRRALLPGPPGRAPAVHLASGVPALMPAAGPQPTHHILPSLRRFLSAAGVVMLALAAAAPALATWMVPPRPFRAKDFTIVKRDAFYHIFYTRTNTLDPNGNTESAFGH